ncbi:MAG TPA: molybdopterin-dependent oxidoreductase [Candidatus Hydrogenedentes bacterium]|nr:molybdopterin-dependent oxidoreductase [Candidatus Hydrogenedentota bacterium]
MIRHGFRFSVSAIVLTAATVAALLFAPGFVGAGPERPSDALTIIDLDGSKITISYDEISKMPQVTELQCICVGQHAGYIGIFDYSGVRLANILEKATAAMNASGYRKENMYAVFRGTDGYQVIASWTELTLAETGRRALVALHADAKALPNTEGRFRIVFPADKYVGRNVKCLEQIEIRCAEGCVDFESH